MYLILLLACRQDAPLPATGCGYPSDADHDLYQAIQGGGSDCNDEDASIFPGAEDVGIDGIDQNCDGLDGPAEACVPTTETCDGLDNDCDGAIDDPLLLSLEQGATTAMLIAAGSDSMLVLGTTPDDGSDGYLDFYHLDGELINHMVGTGQGPTFGQQLSAGRDFDGDGIIDVAVSAPYATTDLGPNTGRVFVLPGPIRSSSTLEDAIFIFEGGELDGPPGTALALAPDMTGDGLSELLVGNYRHTLLFSGGTLGTVGIDAAIGLWELNTGGGAWHFATTPDVDGDGLEELVFGMDTYNSGAGVLWQTNTQHIQTSDGSYGPIDADFWLEGAAGAGVGSKLTRVGSDLWYLSVGVPTRAIAGDTLPYTAVNLINVGDMDGDGQEDIGVETSTGLVVPAVSRELAGYAGFQALRDLGPAQDVSGDGVPDLAWRTYNAAGILDMGLAIGGDCNIDGDLVSGEAGDCEDENPDIMPLISLEACDGIDNNCSGVADEFQQLGILGSFIEGSGMGDGGVVLLSDLGEVSVYGPDLSLAGTLTESLSPGPSQVAGLGDLDGDGKASFVVADQIVHSIYGSDMTLESTFIDGTRFVRAAQVGLAGDIDGDGLGDPWVLGKDSAGELVLLFWHNPSETSILDDADAIMILPSGWMEIVVASAPAGRLGSADMSGDGRDDLVIGNPDAWENNGGRASFVPVINDTEFALDTYAVMTLYGEPDEYLGRSIAIGELNGDGKADAVVGGARGARVVWGQGCVAGAYDIPTDGLWVGDLDSDGQNEVVGSSLSGDVLGMVDTGAVWAGHIGEEPTLVMAGTPRALMGISLFGMGEDLGIVGEDQVWLVESCE